MNTDSIIFVGQDGGGQQETEDWKDLEISLYEGTYRDNDQDYLLSLFR